MSARCHEGDGVKAARPPCAAPAAVAGAARGPLAGVSLAPPPAGLAGAYAVQLLRSLGAALAPAPAQGGQAALEAAQDWAASGLAALTGEPAGPPLMGPAAIASCARGALLALAALAPALPPGLDGAALLCERAALMGLGRRGRVSANGSCHLLRAADGYVAINLAREDDWSLLPALLQGHRIGSVAELSAAVAHAPAAELVARGRIMGLPVAPARPNGVAPRWCTIGASARPVQGGRWRAAHPTVVDLSALWAGPLCSHLLGLAGARVIKVESQARPDGARRGHRAFHALLNAGKDSVALDIAGQRGRGQLRQLLQRADIVIEGSRPRALQQLGIVAEEFIARRPGMTWVSITGYGRSEPCGQWVAFGDDAAVAAGVAAACADPPLFCGDALADPLTGLHAALAALAFHRGGGGVLLDVPLCGVTAHCLGFAPAVPRAATVAAAAGWCLEVGAERLAVRAPAARMPHAEAAALGAHNARWLGSGAAC